MVQRNIDIERLDKGIQDWRCGRIKMKKKVYQSSAI